MPTRRRLFGFLGFVGVMGVVGLAGVAAAQNTSIHGTVSTSGGVGNSATYSNVPFATLGNLLAQDGSDNIGNADGAFSTANGLIQLSTHGCSGGRADWGGDGYGSAVASVSLDYHIVSDALPDGTPVQVHVIWSFSAGARGIVRDAMDIQTNAGASLGGQASVAINNNFVESLSGSYSMADNVSGFAISRSGTLQPDNSTSDHTYTVLVGQIVTISLEAQMAGDAVAESGGASADADSQMAVVWGISSGTPGATVVMIERPDDPVPPAENGTPEHAFQVRPTRPTGPRILQCSTILEQPQNAVVCGSGQAEFTIEVDSQGPTFQWEVARTSDPAATFLPVTEGANAGPGGATAFTAQGSTGTNLILTIPPGFGSAWQGSTAYFRCVVTNLCGSVDSTACALTVNSADFNGDGDVGTDSDIEAFFACLAGTCCATCGVADFNGDGDVGTDADIESFFRVLGGGPC